MPATVEEANAQFDSRRANIVKSWIYKYQKDAADHTGEWPNGFRPWSDGEVNNSLREIWAGLFAFANPQYFAEAEFSALSGRSGVSFNTHLQTYQNKVFHFLETIEEFETIGTDLGKNQYIKLQNDSDARKYWGYTESRTKHGGDYDFVLQNLLQLVYAFVDRPDILTNDMVWEIISQNNTTKRRLQIHTITCENTESWTVEDDFRLYIKQLPSGNRTSIGRTMNNGDKWNVEAGFDFMEEKIQLDAWDIDCDCHCEWYRDCDDHLGTNTIDRSLKHQATVLFNGDDANYKINYSVFVPVPDRHIVIEKLHCSETEDYTGADEVELIITPDGTRKPSLQYSLNNGEDWSINGLYAFNDKVNIRLYDIDNDSWYTAWQDDDDFLGQVDISKNLVEHATATFTRDGADYTLTYSIRMGVEGTDMAVGGVQIINDQVYGKVPVTGQNIDDFVNINFHGKNFFHLPGYSWELDYKNSQGETENHLLGIYSWRYLIQNYIEWVASLSASDPRFDNRLKKVFDDDSQRYRNGADITDYVLQIINRVVYNDMFETNAKIYEAVSINALQTFYSYADKLSGLKTINPSYGGDKIKAAAQNALDYLSAKFAFQSFEGKRLPPQRRNWDSYGYNVDPFGGNYVTDIFGVLSGAYTFNDSIQAAPANIPKQIILKVQSIKCKSEEDIIGGDHLKVKITCDGRSMAPLLNKMEEGQTWNIKSGEYSFNSIAKIKLVEDDDDPDDNLGTITVGPQPVDNAKATIETFWAEYEVTYSVFLKDTSYRPYSVDQMSQHAGFALFSALMDYRLDPAVHDFMLNKHTGFYSRIQSRYTDQSYSLDYDWGIFTTPGDRGFVEPKYFNSDGSIFSGGNFKPVTQVYFATPDYISSAGGKFDRYFDEHQSMMGFDFWIDPLKEYHSISRPFSLITRDNVHLNNSENIAELESKMLIMRGMNPYNRQYGEHVQPECEDENNLWTYKSFTYSENNLYDWPQRYPESWNQYSLPVFTTGGADYKIIDFTNAPETHSMHGYYVLLGRLTTTDFFHSRGFWEIIPGSLYSDGNALKSSIQSFNSQAFSADVYTYQMATTGELIEINSAINQRQKILSIKDKNGKALPLNEYFLDNSSNESLRNLPLISVRGVDSKYNFNGMEYCYSAGDGYVEINNPFIGRYLRLDSRDYKNPTRTVDMPLLTFEDPKFIWTIDKGTVEYDKVNKTEGVQSLKIKGSGYMVLQSPRFDTPMLKKVSNQISIDVFVPSPISNPGWPGYMELYLDIPSAGIYNQIIGHYDFSASQAGQWIPVQFTISDSLMGALSTDNPDMQFRIVLNTNQNGPYYQIDNMHFVNAGTEVEQRPEVPVDVESGSFGSFDNPSLWSCSNAMLESVSTPSSDGGNALKVNGTGYMVIRCSNLTSNDLSNKGNTLAFDLYIPESMSGKGWYGSAALALNIPSVGIYSLECTQVDLTNTYTGSFSTLKFALSLETLAKLNSGFFSDGEVRIILNTPNDAPAYVIDRLGFVN